MNVCRRVRGGRNVQHRLVGLLRQSVYSRLAGYEDTNDAERLADDPTMRVIVGQHQHHEPVRDRGAYPRRQRGRVGPTAEWVDGAIPSHGAPAGGLGHGQFGECHGEQEGSTTVTLGACAITLCSCSTSSGTARAPKAACGERRRPSAHRSCRCWIRSCSRYEAKGVRRYFRADAAFAKPDIGVPGGAASLLRNTAAEQQSAAIRDRSTADTTCGEAAEASSDPIRRLLVSCRELGPRLDRGDVPSGGLHRHEHDGWPRRSGSILQWSWTAEQWIKEGKYALNWTRLSCHRFVANRVRLSLFGSGVQAWELPAPVVSAQGGQALVAAVDQDGRPSGAALPAIDLSLRGVGSSTVVPLATGWIVSAGYRRRQAEGSTTTILPSGGELARDVFNALSPHWRIQDDKDGQEVMVHARIASLIG